jgi:hypothetical protein
MSTRGRIWLAGILFSLATWACLAMNARAATPAKDPKLVTWVHVWGCPTPTSHVVLIFADGHVVKMRVDSLSKEDQQKLVAAIGEIEGVNIAYKCGNEI